MTYYLKEIEDTKEYYADLLILQYHSKYRARETVKMGVDLYLGDGVVFELQDILDIDNAEGAQLDIIGKILDCPRLVPGIEVDKPFFTFEHTGDDYGFSTVGQPSQGYFKSLSYDYSSMYSLPDNDYRLLLKFKAVANRAKASWKDLDDLFYNVFNLGKVFNRSAFTIVGSPTIIDDGVASGFVSGSNPNYISTPVQQLGLADNWELIIPFKTPSTFESTQWIYTSNYGDFYGGVTIGITAGSNPGKLRVALGSTTTSVNDIFEINTHSVQALSDYLLSIKFTGSQYIVKYKINNGEWVTYTIVDSTTKLYNNLNSSRFGVRRTSTSPSEGFNGSIDLKQFSIIIDGVEVFSGLKEQSTIEVINNKNLTITYQIKQSLITDGLLAAIKLNYLEPPLGIGYNIVYVE